MKALFAFAIGMVMLVSAMIVMGVATAEEDELVVDEVVMDEDTVSPPLDSGEGLIIAPPPNADDSSTGTVDVPLITDDQMVVEGVECFLCADGQYHCTGLLSPEEMLDGQPILNPEDMPPIQRPSWTFDDISLPGISDMFIDMDDIFSHIDIPTWQPKKLTAPEPEFVLISLDKRPSDWIVPWPPVWDRTEPVYAYGLLPLPADAIIEEEKPV